ncbi:MAG: DUF975 family protein [Rikenellaceae bacterium]|jgi:uncharacterized membrane protein|nr:DUF975 family protein [Rikenellaceae bacterium]
MKQNIEIMRSAKAALHRNWGMAALVTLLMTVIVSASGAIFIGPLFVTGPLWLGYVFFLKSIRPAERSRVERLFDGFNDFGRSLLAYLLIAIFVFLWSLLLIVPGIVMCIAYSMTFFILAEDKEISVMDAIRRSCEMMRGYKCKYFCLMLRFFGWWVLVVLTFGILYFWVQPYVTMSALHFYRELKAELSTRSDVEAAFTE